MYYFFMMIGGKLRRRYFMQIPEDEIDVGRSQKMLNIQALCFSIANTLTMGAFLAGFLKYLGLSDSFNGFITAAPALLSILQPFGAIEAEKLKQRKLYVVVWYTLLMLMLGALFVLPMLIKAKIYGLIIAVIMFIFAYGVSAFITPANSNWIITLINEKVRGKFFANREIMLIAATAIASVFMGKMLDMFIEQNKQADGYIVMGTFIFVLAIISFFSMSTAMEPEVPYSGTKFDIWSALKTVLADQKYKKCIVVTILWHISTQICIPFLGVYAISNLKLSYTFLTVTMLITSVQKIFLSRWWGKLADKTSWSNAVKYAIGICGVSMFIIALAVPSNAKFMYVFFAIIINICNAGIGFGMMNFQFEYAPEENRTIYIGIGNAIGAVIGFSGVFLGMFLVWILQKNPVQLGNFPLAGQQIAAFISGIIMLYIARYMHKKMTMKS